ncbi:MAG: hypothetical protein PHE49_00445 [bacterium]|nr:hypothetical protein [bacterium]
MKKYFIMLVALVSFTVNTYAGGSFGIKGAYTYGGLKAKIRTIKIDNNSVSNDFSSTSKMEHPRGFGGELFCDIGIPLLPLGLEIGAGFYTENFKEIAGDITTTYTVNSIKFSGLGKYYTKGIPIILPWIGLGPFIGLNTHNVATTILGQTLTTTGNMVPNFGLTIGTGIKIGILPKTAVNVGILLDYYLVSEATSNTGAITTEWTYSQWNLNTIVGISF